MQFGDTDNVGSDDEDGSGVGVYEYGTPYFQPESSVYVYNSGEIDFYAEKVNALTASQKRFHVPAFGAIAGLATLFVSKNNILQRLATIVTMASLAKMHFDVSKETKKTDVLLRREVHAHVGYDSEGEEGDRTLLQGMWSHVSGALREAMQNPREIGGKAVQMGAYLVGAAVLLRSNTAMKVLFLIASSLHIRNIFTQYSSLKNDVQEEMKKVEGREFDRVMENIDFSQSVLELSDVSPFPENTPMDYAWLELKSVSGNLDSRIQSFERAREKCPKSLAIIYQLAGFYLDRWALDDVEKARAILGIMIEIDSYNVRITRLSRRIEELVSRDQVESGNFVGVVVEGSHLTGSTVLDPSDFSRRRLSPYEMGNQYLEEGNYSFAVQSFTDAYTNDRSPKVQVRLGYAMLLSQFYAPQHDPQSFVTAMRLIGTACDSFSQFPPDPIFYCAHSELYNQRALQIINSLQQESQKQYLADTLNTAKETILNASNKFGTSSNLILFTLTQVSISCLRAGHALQSITYYDSALELLEKYESFNPDHTNPEIASQLGYVHLNKRAPDYALAREYYGKAQAFGHQNAQYIESQLDYITRLESEQQSS
jgi:tetratricopeptide (TPR) repeat protein